MFWCVPHHCAVADTYLYLKKSKVQTGRLYELFDSADSASPYEERPKTKTEVTL